MSEKKTTLCVPEAYVPLLEDIRLLKSDEQNPHRMTIKQLGEVWRSLKKHWWAFPIVTDMEGVLRMKSSGLKFAWSMGSFLHRCCGWL